MDARRRLGKYGLRTVALGYLTLLLLVPVGMVFYRAFEDGAAAAWQSVTTPEARHAFQLTLITVAIAVPLNTIFGLGCALLRVRPGLHRWPLLSDLIASPSPRRSRGLGPAPFVV